MTNNLEGFPHRAVFGLGITQLVLCIPMVILEITYGILTSGYGYTFTGASGIWMPMICIAAGAIGVAAGKLQQKPLIVAHMVLSILASVFAFVLMCVASTVASPSYFFGLFQSHYGYYTYLEIPIALLAAAEIIIAIISACLCCQVLCCASRRPGHVVTTHTVIHGQPVQTGMVIHQGMNPNVITYGQPAGGYVGYNHPQLQPGIVAYGQAAPAPQGPVPPPGYAPVYATGPVAPPAYTHEAGKL